jgi:hypothetical protein
VAVGGSETVAGANDDRLLFLGMLVRALLILALYFGSRHNCFCLLLIFFFQSSDFGMPFVDSDKFNLMVGLLSYMS